MGKRFEAFLEFFGATDPNQESSKLREEPDVLKKARELQSYIADQKTLEGAFWSMGTGVEAGVLLDKLVVLVEKFPGNNHATELLNRGIRLAERARDKTRDAMEKTSFIGDTMKWIEDTKDILQVDTR